jgi:hypothetical protein
MLPQCSRHHGTLPFQAALSSAVGPGGNRRRCNNVRESPSVDSLPSRPASRVKTARPLTLQGKSFGLAPAICCIFQSFCRFFEGQLGTTVGPTIQDSGNPRASLLPRCRPLGRLQCRPMSQIPLDSAMIEPGLYRYDDGVRKPAQNCYRQVL